MQTTHNRRGLSVVDVARRFPDGGRGLEDVTFHVEPGSLAAILGPAGAGKSTLLHVISGLDRPTSGSVTVDGIEISALPDRELVALRRERIGVAFQYANLLPMLTIEENALLPLALAGRDADEWWVAEVFETVGLAGRRHERPLTLTSGERRRVVIARALVGKPALLLADEPTAGLDAPAAAQVLSVLEDIAARLGMTVVITADDPRAARSADLVLALRDGRMVEAGVLGAVVAR
jgi:putative ABC transport system ATP-binding protein